MIEKIISNGQTTVAAVALDVAIKLGLTYGGWCREGESIADRYRLERLPGASVGAVIEKSVGAGQGTLYLTQGDKASLRLEATKRVALRLNKPLLIIDLAREKGFFASRRIAQWSVENQIQVLHIDGEMDSTADGVANILEATFFLAMMDSGIPSPLQPVLQREPIPQPRVVVETVEAALDHLEGTMSLKDRATMANMAAGELVSLHASIGEYINRHFDLFLADSSLLTDCRRRSGQWDLAPVDATAVIIRALWDRLRGNCRIRIVK